MTARRVDGARQITWRAVDAGCEPLAVGLPQGRNQRVAVFAGDSAVFVAMAMVKTGLFHEI